MSYIFPDIEPVIVSHLVDSLAGIDSPLSTGVRVGTVKLPADAEQPAKQVVVTAAYQNQTEYRVTAEASAVIEVYADDYGTASYLALLIGALIVQIPGEHIKRSVVALGPVRTSDEGPQEKRSMTVDFIVKATDL